MFLLNLQTLIQTYLPTAEIRIEDNSLYFKHEKLFEYAKITEKRGYAVLDQLYVKTGHQRTGIGTKILELLISACQTNGLTYIECRATQGGALHGVDFCKKHKFTQRPHCELWFKNI